MAPIVHSGHTTTDAGTAFKQAGNLLMLRARRDSNP